MCLNIAPYVLCLQILMVSMQRRMEIHVRFGFLACHVREPGSAALSKRPSNAALAKSVSNKSLKEQKGTAEPEDEDYLLPIDGSRTMRTPDFLRRGSFGLSARRLKSLCSCLQTAEMCSPS